MHNQNRKTIDMVLERQRRPNGIDLLGFLENCCSLSDRKSLRKKTPEKSWDLSYDLENERYFKSEKGKNARLKSDIVIIEVYDIKIK